MWGLYNVLSVYTLRQSGRVCVVFSLIKLSALCNVNTSPPECQGVCIVLSVYTVIWKIFTVELFSFCAIINEIKLYMNFF